LPKDGNFTEEDIRTILQNGFFEGPDGVLYFTKEDGVYTKDAAGNDIKVQDPRVDDTVPQDQRMMVREEDQSQLATRKTQFDRRTEYLTDVKSDIPDHILKSNLFYTSLTKHNQLLNISKEEKAEAECDSFMLDRLRDWDRGNSEKYTKFDEMSVHVMESRLLSKSVGGFERIMLNKEIVETQSKDLNAPIKNNSPGVLGSVMNWVRGKR